MERENKKITIFELFGGIGSPRKALENLGYDIKSMDYVEVLNYAVMAYNRIYDNKYGMQDITKWTNEVDILIHGSPCQDWSQAGKRNIATGRSLLFLETLRIIENEFAKKPKWIVWENVDSLLQKCKMQNCPACNDFQSSIPNVKDYSCYEKDNNCQDYIKGINDYNEDKESFDVPKKACHWYFFNYYLWKLSKLGYDSTFKVLNAKDFGIPQNRKRVFVVSKRKDISKKFCWDNLKESKMIPLSYFLECGQEWKTEKTYKEFENFYTIPRKTDGKLENGNYNRVWKISKFVGSLTASVINKIGFIDSNNVLNYRELTEKETWLLMGYEKDDFKKVRNSLKDYLDDDVDISYYIKQKSMIKAIEEGKIKIINNLVSCITTKQWRWNNAGVVKIPLTTFNKDNYIYSIEEKEINTIMDNNCLKIATPINDTQMFNFTSFYKESKLYDFDLSNGSVDTLKNNFKYWKKYLPFKSVLKVNEDFDYKLADGSPRKAGVVRQKEGNIIIPISTMHQNNICAMPNGNINTLTVATRQKIFIPAEEYLGDDIPIFEIDGKYYYLRILTEKEVWRLMGYDNVSIDNVKELPKTALYHLAGNSIVVNVMEAIFREILE